jgi:membrane fusion protein (multidrug efflux system)
VDLGQRRDGRVEVRSGLAAKDVVVTAGQIKLREGQPVTIVSTHAGKSTAAAAPASGQPPTTPPKAETTTPPPPGRS